MPLKKSWSYKFALHSVLYNEHLVLSLRFHDGQLSMKIGVIVHIPFTTFC